MAKDWKAYEVAVAKHLGAWWGSTFRRTPSSGAWSTQGRRYGNTASNDFHGDIVTPPEAKFPFSVECKVYKSVEIYLSLYGKSNVHDWWEQCLADAHSVRKWPLLVMRENNKKPLAVISAKLWEALYTHTSFDLTKVRAIHMTWMNVNIKRSIVVMSLQAFTDNIPSAKLKKLANK